MSEHTVSSYDEELRALAGRVAEMGGLAEALVNDAVTALLSQDLEKAHKTILQDARLDELQQEIEAKFIRIVALRQPMGQDLREIMAAGRIANDLERVGDLAKNIAKRVIAIEGEYHPQKLVRGVEHISELVLEQLKEVLDAYAGRNQAKALEVWGRDGAIDTIYTSLFRELLTYMMEDPRNISVCTHLLFCAKNIERMGDHATNVAEIVYYMVTGEVLPESRPKADASSDTTVAFPGTSAKV